MMYSYNGVVLAPLPNWDKATYPYALMIYMGLDFLLGEVVLYLTSKPMVYYPDEYYNLQANDGGTFRKIQFTGNVMLIDGSHKNIWQQYDKGTDDAADSVGRTAFWANYDILNEDGSLYLAASDPIPVRSPSAMMLGYQLGQAVRRMRG